MEKVDYMTNKEVCDFLEITENYSEEMHSRILSKLVKIFKLECNRKRVNGHVITFYNKTEIVDMANKVTSFFDDHYTHSVAVEMLGSSINYSRFKPVPIPEGYITIMKTSTGCGMGKSVYKKSEIDAYSKFKKQMTEDINKGVLISRKEAMSIIGISERPFNKIRYKLKETEFNTTYYYKKEEVENLKKEYWDSKKNGSITPGFINKD